jgi:hypothetical protein
VVTAAEWMLAKDHVPTTDALDLVFVRPRT